jgi:hypothetical protein
MAFRVPANKVLFQIRINQRQIRRRVKPLLHHYRIGCNIYLSDDLPEGVAGLLWGLRVSSEPIIK